MAGDLIVNPHAEVRLPDDGGPIESVVVRAPIRGQSLKLTKIERKTESDLFGMLLIHALQVTSGGPGVRWADASETERARLASLGLLVHEDRISTPVTFACDVDSELDDDTASLVPRRTPQPPIAADLSRLMVNPTLRHLGTSGPTREMRGRVKTPNPFRPGRAWLSVDGDRPSVRSFYSWSPSTSPDLSQLAPGGDVPSSFDASTRRRLVEAGIAGDPSTMSRLGDIRACASRDLAARLSADRHIVIPHAIAPRQLAAIRRYYRELIAEGWLIFGDKDWPNRYFARYDPIAHFFHEQWTALTTEVGGEPYKASFPFFTSYYPGSDLPAHRDREQCVLGASVLLDHAPEPVDESSWPIYLQPPGADRAFPVAQGIGDAAMFYGREVQHHRDALTEGFSSMWFFFYVEASFDGPLD